MGGMGPNTGSTTKPNVGPQNSDQVD